jgi:GntR family transcriptional regulator, L-lactate dehydrogenase operon regulator
LAVSSVLSAFSSHGAVEHAYEQLVAAILDGVVEDGERLPTEAQLVDTLQVSRPTVREALQMLGQAGMVERRRGRYGGWYVARRQSDRISDALAALVILERISFGEIFEARAMVEATAASLAARRTLRGDLQLMRQAISDSEAAPADAETFTRTNALFHLALVHASGNGVLTIMMSSLRPLIDESLHQITLDAPNIEHANVMHRLILEAIEGGDPERAREAVEIHLNHFRVTMEQAKGNLSEITVSARAAVLGSIRAVQVFEPSNGDGHGHT